MISLLHVYNLGQTASIIIRLMWSLKLGLYQICVCVLSWHIALTKAATLSTPVGSGEEEEDITDVDSEEERERDVRPLFCYALCYF